MSPKKPVRKLILSPSARDDLEFWERESPKTIEKINALLASIMDDLESGIGKPEKLKYELTGLWSRRINHRDRMVYEAGDDFIFVLQLRDHY